jgi:hypothetical protein
MGFGGVTAMGARSARHHRFSTWRSARRHFLAIVASAAQR